MGEESQTQTVDDLLQRALRAAAVFNQLDQEHTDLMSRSVPRQGIFSNLPSARKHVKELRPKAR